MKQQRDNILKNILKHIEINGFITIAIARRRFQITESKAESYINTLRKRGLIHPENRHGRKTVNEPFRWILGQEPEVVVIEDLDKIPDAKVSQKRVKSWKVNPFQHWEPMVLFYGIKGKE